MTILCLLALFMAGDWPVPIARWEISFVPAFAVVREDGSSLVFDQNGQVVYEYDIHGQLTTSFTLETPVLETFASPNGTALVYLENQLLAGLNPSGNLRWQRELKPSTVEPVPFGQFMLYTVDDKVMLIDPFDGTTHFSLQHNQQIGSVFAFDGQIWISDQSGATLSWEPFTEKKAQHPSPRKQMLEAAVRLPKEWYALVADDGLIEVYNAKGKRRWTRHFRIDIASRPLVLQGKDEAQLVVSTRGRNLFAFSAEAGIQRLRRLLDVRPRALVGFGRELALLIGEHSRELWWYHAPSGRFEGQPLNAVIDEYAESESYLLLLADDGTIRLFKK